MGARPSTPINISVRIFRDDVKDFKDINNDFHCPICTLAYNTDLSDLISLPCSATLCNNCFMRLDKCPFCNDESGLKKITGKFHTELVEKLRNTTINCAECDKKILYGYLLKHLITECKTKYVHCVSKDCDYYFKENSIYYDAHISNCDYVTVSCEYCHENIMKKNIEEHSDLCLKKPLKCRLCDAKIFLQNYDNHIKNDCINRIEKCKICDELYIYQYEKSHKKECKRRKIHCTGCDQLVPRFQLRTHNCMY